MAIKRKSTKRTARRNPKSQIVEKANASIEELRYVISILKPRVDFIDRTNRVDGEYVRMLEMYLKEMSPSIRKLYNLAYEYQFNIRDDHMEE